MRWSDLAGRSIVIVGIGREGRAVAERLVPDAGSLRAVDEVEGDAADAWREYWGGRVPLVIAPGPDDLAGLDAAIVSPGIPPRAPVRRLLAQLGIPETTATDLWLAEHASRTTAVTGSKGKSTTASLVHALSVAHEVDAALGGNIGIPLLSLPPADRYVAELSSYQASSVTRSPDVVVLTALFPEHLDWHGDAETYFADKLNLVGHGARRVIANAADQRLLAELARRHSAVELELAGGAQTLWGIGEHAGVDWIVRDGVPIVRLDALTLAGRHNARNATLALAAVEASGTEVDADVARRVLGEFQPLEHRLEAIPDPSGVTFVDDTLSTSPYATIAALEALDRNDVVLLVGGQDRGVDYAPLAGHLAVHPIAGVVGMPDSGSRIVGALAAVGIPGVVAQDMLEAVAAARGLAPEEGIVLLSPAAPSYGRYRDFADRAADFRRAIAATAPP